MVLDTLCSFFLMARVLCCVLCLFLSSCCCILSDPTLKQTTLTKKHYEMLHVSYTFPPNNPHVVRERDEAMNVNWQVPWKV